MEQVMKLSGKKRKKLYIKIKTQMEFYFSDNNLAKDKFLLNRIRTSPDGYVELELFKTFNKIKELIDNSDDVSVIASALTKSSILEVSEDKQKVKRKDPPNIDKDFDACTLYVEGLPAYADERWIRKIFENFGTVIHIHIPHFNISQKIKGFAFIEYSCPESVINASKYFEVSEKEEVSETEKKESRKENTKNSQEKRIKKDKRVKSSLDGKNASPKEVKTLQSETDMNLEVKKSFNKRKRKSEHSYVEGKASKKQKISSEENSPSIDIEENISIPIVQEGQELVEDISMNAVNEEMETNSLTGNIVEEVSNKKKKRKHSKKNRNRHEHSKLRVMLKSEWKVYRNKYLDLQRTTMKSLKKQILLDLQEIKQQENSSKTEPVPKTELKFQPGVILKLKLSKPVDKPPEVKEQIKACAVVAYIEATYGSEEIFIRCNTAEDAKSIIESNKLNRIGCSTLLTGVEEIEYWNKIQADRKAKFANPVKIRPRGRDKLILKATKLLENKNKHIYFDE